jgi:hypothetical protein
MEPSKNCNLYLITVLLSLILSACGGGGKAAPTTAAGPSLTFAQTKFFRFSWIDVANATHYKLLEDPDGVSGFTQVGPDIDAGNQQYDHSVPLYARVNARYILQSCNSGGCNDSSTLNVSGTLVDAVAYFKPSNTGADDLFGYDVSLAADSNTLAVGAFEEDSNSTGINSTPNDDGNANDSGATYVFTRSNGAWVQQAYIKASNTNSGDRFGNAVTLAADGNTLAVGAFEENSNTTGVNSTPNDDGNANDSGAVYVFTRSNGAWTQQAYIKASNTDADDRFGNAVTLAADGNTLAVSADSEDSNTTGINSTPNDDGNADRSGAAYVFTRSNGVWTQQSYIKASNTGAGDLFGNAVSLAADGNALAVSARFENSNTSGINGTPNDDGNADRSGAAYVFTRSDGVWTQQAYIKASNTGASDGFGYDVALTADGNTLAVGAPFEDSNTTGINSTPSDDGNANTSGAAYVFTRSDGVWTQQAYIKASNTGADDRFGFAVSLVADGNTLAVGATKEDSNTTGINSTPNDDGGANDSGAVYVFTHSDGDWVQQAYIKASNTGANDRFGVVVTLATDGNTLAVSANVEDSNTTGINSTPNEDAFNAGAVYLY